MNRVTSRIAAAVLLTPGLVVIGSASAHATTYHCHGRVATIVGTPDADSLSGTAGDDVIVGLGGHDTIDGGAGNDVICGNAAADHITGGDGADTIYGQRGNDVLLGGVGDDVLSGGIGTTTKFVSDAGDDRWYSRTRTDILFYDAGVTLDLRAGTATGMGSDALHLHDGHAEVFLQSNDGSTVFGSDHSDDIIGYEGTDTVDARGGDDTVVVGGQGSVAYGGAGNDDLQAYHPNMEITLDGGDGDDGFTSWDGNSVNAGPGNDRVSAQFLPCPQCSGSVPPDHALHAGAGNDTLFLTADPDDPFYDDITFDMNAGTVDADGTVASVTGFENLSVLSPTSTRYDVTGTDGPNSITWNDNHATVVVHGLGGDDTMNGGSADDTFYGGLGDDTADGQGGTDTCTSIEHRTSCAVANP